MGILRGQRSSTFAGLLIVIAIIEFAPDRVSGGGRVCKSGLGPCAEQRLLNCWARRPFQGLCLLRRIALPGRISTSVDRLGCRPDAGHRRAGSRESGPELSPVRGQVMIDGLPLEGAIVEFRPDKGQPSTGVTDAQGMYELRFTDGRMGAVIGRHTVRITMANETDESPRARRVPERYNIQTDLRGDILPGPNYWQFELASR